ncbi:MAG: hypothetical protein KA419_04675 [Acidobacteria bacterium]|nr:hypothetical protein [Acidobacteriota bacterium]
MNFVGTDARPGLKTVFSLMVLALVLLPACQKSSSDPSLPGWPGAAGGASPQPLPMEDNPAFLEAYYKVFNLLTAEGGAGDEQAIAELQRFVSDPATPRWGKVMALVDLAALGFKHGNADLGLGSFEKAVDEGFNDFIFVHQTDCLKSYFSDPRFQAAYGRMTISPADRHEMTWLHQEYMATNHDTSMMITANMNRKDEDRTGIVQVDLPTRPTGSITLIGLRQVLRLVQRYQRDLVAQSDQSRIMHLMNRNIIDNMNPSSGSYGYGNDPGEQRRRSSLAAQQRFEQHRADIARRQYNPPGNLSESPEPVPPLGSLQLQ